MVGEKSGAATRSRSFRKLFRFISKVRPGIKGKPKGEVPFCPLLQPQLSFEIRIFTVGCSHSSLQSRLHALKRRATSSSRSSRSSEPLAACPFLRPDRPAAAVARAFQPALTSNPSRPGEVDAAFRRKPPLRRSFRPFSIASNGERRRRSVAIRCWESVRCGRLDGCRTRLGIGGDEAGWKAASTGGDAVKARSGGSTDPSPRGPVPVLVAALDPGSKISS